MATTSSDKSTVGVSTGGNLMKLLFQDESGDLGFDFSKSKTSRFFVITIVLMDESAKRSAEKVVKNVFRKFAEPKSHKEGVLHAANEKPVVRSHLLKGIAKKDIAIYAVILNKARVNDDLRKQPAKLYNFVTKTLLRYVYKKGGLLDANKNELVASRRETNRLLNDDFCHYLEGQMKKMSSSNFVVRIAPPYEEKCLQIVDFACWSVYRTVAHGDDSYQKLLGPGMVKTIRLFFLPRT
jgi:hypothetical protein